MLTGPNGKRCANSCRVPRIWDVGQLQLGWQLHGGWPVTVPEQPTLRRPWHAQARFCSRVQAEVATPLDEPIRASLDFTDLLTTEKVEAIFGREELARLLR